MATQVHTQKSTPDSTTAAAQSSFQPRPFAVQAKEDGLDEEQGLPDLQAELERAARFGHSLDRISVQPPAATIAPVQSKAATLPIQRQEEEGGEEEEGQMKAQTEPIQQSNQPVQFFIAMLLPLIMPMLQPISTIAVTEDLSRSQIEARLLQRAMQEPVFRQTLVQDPPTIWQQEFGDDPVLKDLQLQVLEETETSLYLVLPSQDEAFRQELLQTPQAVWKREFGTTDLQGYVIRVVQEPEGHFYLVLPFRQRSAGWLDEFPQMVPPPWTPPDVGTLEKSWRTRPRRMPTTKLGRIWQRLQTWVAMMVKTNPLVAAILRPFYWVRSLMQAWNRL